MAEIQQWGSYCYKYYLYLMLINGASEFPCAEHTELQSSLLICLMNSDSVFRI